MAFADQADANETDADAVIRAENVLKHRCAENACTCGLQKFTPFFHRLLLGESGTDFSLFVRRNRLKSVPPGLAYDTSSAAISLLQGIAPGSGLSELQNWR